MPGEQSWPTQPHPDQARRRTSSTRSRSTTSARICRRTEADAFKKRLLAADEQGHLHADQPERHGARADEQRRRAVRRHGRRAAHRRRLCRRARQPGHSPAAAPGRDGRRRRRRRCRRARLSTSRTARRATAPNRQGTETGVPLVHADGRSGQQHRRRRAALRRGGDPRGDRDRQGPHAAVSASDARPTSIISSRS